MHVPRTPRNPERALRRSFFSPGLIPHPVSAPIFAARQYLFSSTLHLVTRQYPVLVISRVFGPRALGTMKSPVHQSGNNNATSSARPCGARLGRPGRSRTGSASWCRAIGLGLRLGRAAGCAQVHMPPGKRYRLHAHAQGLHEGTDRGRAGCDAGCDSQRLAEQQPHASRDRRSDLLVEGPLLTRSRDPRRRFGALFCPRSSWSVFCD